MTALRREHSLEKRGRAGVRWRTKAPEEGMGTLQLDRVVCPAGLPGLLCSARCVPQRRGAVRRSECHQGRWLWPGSLRKALGSRVPCLQLPALVPCLLLRLAGGTVSACSKPPASQAGWKTGTGHCCRRRGKLPRSQVGRNHLLCYQLGIGMQSWGRRKPQWLALE